MKTPRFVAASKSLFVFSAMLVLMQSCASKTPLPTVDRTGPLAVTRSISASTAIANSTHTPEPPTLAAIPPTPTTLPIRAPAADYRMPAQFIARLNFGGIERFAISAQLDRLVVGNTSQICLFTAMDFTLEWCALTVPESIPLIPGEASSSNELGKMVFRQDGMQLAVALWNGYTLILDASSGDLLNAFSTGQESINNLAWSPDGRLIFAYRHREPVQVWEAATGKMLRQWDIDPQVHEDFEWSSDGSLFATTEYTGTEITIWDTGQIVPTSTFEIQSAGFVSSLAFSPDDKTLYAGISMPFPCEENCDTGDLGYQGWIATYDIESGSLYGKTLVGDAISRLAISPDGNLVASGGGIFGSFILLDSQTGRVKVKLAGTHADKGLGWLDNHKVLFLPELQHIDVKSLSQWDVSWTEHSEIYLPGFETIESLAWLADSERLITDAAGGMLSLWQASTGQQLEQFQLMIGGEPVKRFEPGWISPVNDQLAVVAQDSIAIVDLDTREVIKWMDHSDLGERINVTDLTWSRDGQQLMAGIVDLDHVGKVAVAVWEVNSGKRLLTIPADWEREIHSLAFSPDGKQIAIGRVIRGAEFQHQLITMDVATGKELQKLDMETDSMKAIWLTPNQIAFEYCNKTHIWNLTDGSDREVPGTTSYPAIRADGSLAASPCFGVGISVWDFQTGGEVKCLEVLVDSFGYKSLSFNPDGRFLASLTKNGSVLLWDLGDFNSP